jgi:hypothetical protein
VVYGLVSGCSPIRRGSGPWTNATSCQIFSARMPSFRRGFTVRIVEESIMPKQTLFDACLRVHFPVQMVDVEALAEFSEEELKEYGMRPESPPALARA